MGRGGGLSDLGSAVFFFCPNHASHWLLVLLHVLLCLYLYRLPLAAWLSAFRRAFYRLKFPAEVSENSELPASWSSFGPLHGSLNNHDANGCTCCVPVGSGEGGGGATMAKSIAIMGSVEARAITSPSL